MFSQKNFLAVAPPHPYADRLTLWKMRDIFILYRCRRVLVIHTEEHRVLPSHHRTNMTTKVMHESKSAEKQLKKL